jgi:hypothetical protein
VHFYYIFNPTTGAADTIASASATAPAGLPSGYSAWAYIGADYLTAGAILSAGYMRGSWFTYRTSGGGVNAGSAVVSTAVNLSAAVPPNALELKINVANIGISAAAGGIYGLTLVLELVAGSLAYQAGLQGIAPAAGNAMFISGGFVVLPNIGQNVNYYLTITAGAGPTTTWGITGFKMPNGGE